MMATTAYEHFDPYATEYTQNYAWKNLPTSFPHHPQTILAKYNDKYKNHAHIAQYGGMYDAQTLKEEEIERERREAERRAQMEREGRKSAIKYTKNIDELFRYEPTTGINNYAHYSTQNQEAQASLTPPAGVNYERVSRQSEISPVRSQIAASPIQHIMGVPVYDSDLTAKVKSDEEAPRKAPTPILHHNDSVKTQQNERPAYQYKPYETSLRPHTGYSVNSSSPYTEPRNNYSYAAAHPYDQPSSLYNPSRASAVSFRDSPRMLDEQTETNAISTRDDATETLGLGRLNLTDTHETATETEPAEGMYRQNRLPQEHATETDDSYVRKPATVNDATETEPYMENTYDLNYNHALDTYLPNQHNKSFSAPLGRPREISPTRSPRSPFKPYNPYNQAVANAPFLPPAGLPSNKEEPFVVGVVPHNPYGAAAGYVYPSGTLGGIQKGLRIPIPPKYPPPGHAIPPKSDPLFFNEYHPAASNRKDNKDRTGPGHGPFLSYGWNHRTTGGEDMKSFNVKMVPKKQVRSLVVYIGSAWALSLFSGRTLYRSKGCSGQ